MSPQSYTEEELGKFLEEILTSDLSISIFQQLIEDGGNTVAGLIESMQENGIKTAKTRVYEEISTLLEKGLIKRISKRPPVYTVDLSRDNLEELASKFYMETREELMRRWAASYTFLPEFLKKTEKDSTGLSGIPIVDFNPYPIVDTFSLDKNGLQRYLLRVFEANKILISNTVIDVFTSSENYRRAFEKDDFKPLLEVIESNFNKKGTIVLNTLSNFITKEVMSFRDSPSLTKFYQQFFRHINYEIRKPNDELSSFVIGNNNILIPIGIGGLALQTFMIIEIRQPKVIKKAQTTFNKVWNNATPILKIENGEIIKY